MLVIAGGDDAPAPIGGLLPRELRARAPKARREPDEGEQARRHAASDGGDADGPLKTRRHQQFEPHQGRGREEAGAGEQREGCAEEGANVAEATGRRSCRGDPSTQGWCHYGWGGGGTDGVG